LIIKDSLKKTKKMNLIQLIGEQPTPAVFVASNFVAAYFGDLTLNFAVSQSKILFE
tara:strand:- start:193 stop:360 length:168 start_codon:yes stop_codon:yes gene_type:complete